jgi:hypothetical protein
MFFYLAKERLRKHPYGGSLAIYEERQFPVVGFQGQHSSVFRHLWDLGFIDARRSVVCDCDLTLLWSSKIAAAEYHSYSLAGRFDCALPLGLRVAQGFGSLS